MAYSKVNSKGQTYFLHARPRKLKSGKTSFLYYFSKTEKEDAIDAVPDGYKPVETANGLFVLKKTG